MLNFTVGPVQMDEEIKRIGAEDIPYFRTFEFSEVMFDNERILLKLFKAPKGSRVVFLTGSGTAGMEASVMNVLDKNDKAIVINGGSFGKRFADICEIHDIDFSEIVLRHGQALTKEHLSLYENAGYTALLVNVHETSTGVLYDMPMISEFCKRNNLKCNVGRGLGSPSGRAGTAQAVTERERLIWVCRETKICWEMPVNYGKK